MLSLKGAMEMKNHAAEELALRAMRAGCSIEEIVDGQTEVRYDVPGAYRHDETVERSAEITPELIAEARAVLDGKR
jgi:hypothetical protein